ncbi:MAG TPA: carboxypeptidase-like regulatory domain-containing protein [Polyangiaceae bacterium]|nr:carboxypeptidase-like regulatory domain-containing protein [Polyangiaceae bacterium]
MHKAKSGMIRGVAVSLLAIGLLAAVWVLVSRRDPSREAPTQAAASVVEADEAVRAVAPAITLGAEPGAARLEGLVPAENGSPVPAAVLALGEGVDGRVVDANGGPVAGAFVTAREVSAGGQVTAATLSDSRGSFHLEVSSGLLELAARAEGYSSMTRHVAAPARDATLVLAPGTSIQGRVLTQAADMPIGGARVTAINEDGLLLRGLEAETSGDGAFLIEGLVAGSYTLRVTADGFQDQQQGFRVLGPGEQSAGTLRMAAAATLRASVTVAGRPCSGATVLLDGPTGVAATSDADGLVTVTNARPGRYSVKVSCPDARPFDGALELSSDAPTTRHFELEAGLALRGTVRRFGGEPLPHAAVVVVPVTETAAAAPGSRELGSAECVADDTARFVCRGLSAGSYDVSVRTAGLQSGPAVRVVMSAGREPSVDVVAPASGTLKITLNGTPSASAIVVASGGPDQATRQATRTGGAFVFDGLALGRYRVRLASSTSTSVDAALSRDGELVALTLAAPQDRAISGHVLDEQGQPVPDAWVVARSNDEQNHSREGAGEPALTDGDGAFVIPGLLDGQYGLVATSSSGQAIVEAVLGGTENVKLVVSARDERGP